MKQITALILFLMVLLIVSCNQSDELSDLENRVNELEGQLDSTNTLNYGDSLEFILAMNEFEYKKYLDSLRRADSLNVESGNLPFSYNVLVYDGSTTSVYSNGGERTSAFDAEVSVSVSQFGETRTITTTDGHASFGNIGRGIVKVTVSAEGYTTLQYSFETTIDPTTALYPGLDTDSDFWDFIKTGSLGHDVALFATQGTNASILTGRVFVETDLTNGTREVVPEGTVITATIDVEDFGFQEEFILFRNKLIFTDNILSFGYDPIFTAATDASGDYTLTLAGAANEDGLPYHFEYSDFVADQTVYLQNATNVTEVTDQVIFGPNVGITPVPIIDLEPFVDFWAGGGATATLFTSAGTNNELVIDSIGVVTVGNGYLVPPRVEIYDGSGGVGSGAVATAVLDGNGQVGSITLDNPGDDYTDPQIVIVDPGTTFNPDNDIFADPVLYANPAVGEVVVENGVITGIVITAVGDNYPAGTLVLLDAIRGTGFSGTATVTNGEVVSVTVDTGGNDYIDDNEPGAAVGFSGIGFSGAKTGITRVIDIEYGTGFLR